MRLDGGPQDLAARLVLGEGADLLRVEEEELRDLEREEILDELAPVVGVPAIRQAIDRDLRLLPDLPALHAPGAADLVDVLFPAGGVAEDERDPCPVALTDAVVDRLAEELVIREIRPLRASRADTVERELNRVEQRCLAGPVGAAKQDDRAHPGIAGRGEWSQVEGLFAAVEAEVPQRHAFQDHAGRPLVLESLTPRFLRRRRNTTEPRVVAGRTLGVPRRPPNLTPCPQNPERIPQGIADWFHFSQRVGPDRGTPLGFGGEG